MVTDTIGDSLIRIKNAYLSVKPDAALRYSKIVLSICEVLKKEGYIADVMSDNQREITVTLKYRGKLPSVSNVKRISKPGLRVYKGSSELPRVLGGLGIALISTPKGVLTDKQARKEKVGGEVLAYVW